jgi:hypothetical protein
VIIPGQMTPVVVPTRVVPQPGQPLQSNRVRGTLDRQFQTHTLALTAVDFRRPLRVVMNYVPQGRWELDDRSGFFILDREGLDAYRAGAIPGSLAIAAGDAMPGMERILQAIILTPDRPFFIVIYNDSPLPMNYTLQVENGFFVDEQGGQVIDVWNPPASAFPGGSVPPVIVVPGPSATPTPLPTSAAVRGRTMRGVLTARYDTNYYTLDVIDTNQPVTFEMTYDPPGQFMQDMGIEFNVFSEEQFQILRQEFLLPWVAADTTEGHLEVQPDGRFVWRAEIQEPFARYYVAVSQYRYGLLWLRYRLAVTNAILTDESGESVPLPQPTVTPTVQLRTTPFPGDQPLVVVQSRPRGTDTPTPTITPTPTETPTATVTPTATFPVVE